MTKKMEAAGIKNKSTYARRMLLDGYIIRKDYSILREYLSELKRIGNNLNQIARVANEYYAIDFPQLQEMIDEVAQWQQLIPIPRSGHVSGFLSWQNIFRKAEEHSIHA